MRKITKIVLTLVSLPGILIPALGQTGQIDTIEQERYTYQMEVTQKVIADTFVIIEGNKQDNILYDKTYSKKDIKIGNHNNGISTSRQTLKTAILATCSFQFDSPVLNPTESDKILSILAKKNLKNIPLAVTGYTCPLGPNEYNQALSLQRAEAVAAILREHGYQVETVQGKGSQNLVTHYPHQFRMNRRVTVRVVKK